MEPGDTITLCRYKRTTYKDQYGITHEAYQEYDVLECVVLGWVPIPNGYQAEAKSPEGLIFTTYYEGLSIGDEPLWYCTERSGHWRMGPRDRFAGLAVIKEQVS